MVALVTAVSYCLVGIAVAAVLGRGEARGAMGLARMSLQACLWPLFLPVLLPSPSAPTGTPENARIDAAEATLHDALQRLGRELGDSLSLETARVRSLGTALRSAARRLSELESVLSAPDHDREKLSRELAALEARSDSKPVADILRERLAHLSRLEALRTQARTDLERALARAGELATRLTLLRYEGATAQAAGRARELTDTIDELCRTLEAVRAA
jgi:chromosome segregation ATPase